MTAVFTPGRLHRWWHAGAVAALLALIVLCVWWEILLAPLRPGGSWLVLKMLPLLLPLLGVIRRDVYTLQWASMLILLYFTEGVVRAYASAGLNARLGLIEIAMALAFFICTLAYLRPIKQTARKLAKQAIQKASQTPLRIGNRDAGQQPADKR